MHNVFFSLLFLFLSSLFLLYCLYDRHKYIYTRYHTTISHHFALDRLHLKSLTFNYIRVNQVIIYSF